MSLFVLIQSFLGFSLLLVCILITTLQIQICILLFLLTLPYKHFPMFYLCFVTNIFKSKWHNLSAWSLAYFLTPFYLEFSAPWIWITCSVAELLLWGIWEHWVGCLPSFPGLAETWQPVFCPQSALLWHLCQMRTNSLSRMLLSETSVDASALCCDSSPENPVSLLLMEQVNGETDGSDPENITWSLPVSFHLLWSVWALKGCSELQS